MKKVYLFIALSAVVVGVLAVGSVVLALLGFGDDDRRPSQAASVAQPYVDPAHRFRMTIPAGCRLDRQDDAATTFRCGTTWPSEPITYSYATVAFRPGGTRQSDLQLLVNRLIAGWHDLKVLKNDRKATLHGRPARVIFASGTDSRGLVSKIEIVAVAGHHQWCAVAYASPDLQWGYDSHTYLKPMLAGFRPT